MSVSTDTHRWAIITTLLVGLVLGSIAAPSVILAATHVTVEAGRVRMGPHDFVPRFTTLPRVLVVERGEEFTLPPDSTWDAIEVAGTLRVSRAHDTRVRFIHLMILPGGYLDAGTVEDPVLRSVEFIVRDVPIDTTRDPFQWGNGLINFGRQTRIGRRLARTWTELSQDAEAGAQSIRLEVPEGWQVGDELLLPDMRGLTPRGAAIRREVPVHIVAIEGDRITLSKPLDFEHLSITDPDGAVVLRPRVANLTRNIVLRSENPQGTRGHTVNIGHQASWDIRYNQFVGLGRTRNETLDNTTDDLRHIGTNQIAKYADHDHHAEGFGTASIGNSYQGMNGAKWGHVVHGTHDTRLEDNVCVDFVGGCFVTEDGYEIRNVFRRNVAAYAKGNGIGALGNVAKRQGRNCPGCEGSGFWFRGPRQVIVENEAWNNATGINLFNREHNAAPFPSEPGGAADTNFEERLNVPLLFRGNVTISNDRVGLEYWSVARFPAEDHVSAYNRERQFWVATSPSNYTYFRNVTLIGKDGHSTCVATSSAYAEGLEVDGGKLKGCNEGVPGGGARQYMRLRNLVLQNRQNVIYNGFPAESRLENLEHRPLGSFPKRYIYFGDGYVWDGASQESIPPKSARGYVSQRGSPHVVLNWQGTGQNYRLLELQQRRSTMAWPADWPERPACCGTDLLTPEAGLTMGEAWDKYGLAYGGDVVADQEAVALDGLINGIARPGLSVPLGPPRAILTFPNRLNPALIETDGRDGRSYTRLHLVVTGDGTGTDGGAFVQVDGGARVPVPGSAQGEEHRALPVYTVAPGPHEVRTWRTDQSGRIIPSSEMRFEYFVEGK